MTRNTTMERSNFFCRKQRKNKSLEHLYAVLVELISRADCVDREYDWVQGMFTAYLTDNEIAEELLDKIRSLQKQMHTQLEEKNGTEHSITMTTSSFRSSSSASIIKQEPMGCTRPRGRGGQNGYLILKETGYSRDADISSPEENKILEITKTIKEAKTKRFTSAEGNLLPNNYIHAQQKNKIYTKYAKRGQFAQVSRKTNVNYIQEANRSQCEEGEGKKQSKKMITIQCLRRTHIDKRQGKYTT